MIKKLLSLHPLAIRPYLTRTWVFKKKGTITVTLSTDTPISKYWLQVNGHKKSQNKENYKRK